MVAALDPPQERGAVRAARCRGRHRRHLVPRRRSGGRGFQGHGLRHQRRDARRRARTRAATRQLDEKVAFVEGNAEELPFGDRSFDAYTIAFGIRNVPRIDAALREAYRVLRPAAGFCVWNSPASTCRASTALYDLFSFNVIPQIGRAVTGDAESYRYLVESIRKFPQAQRVCRHDPRRRLFAGEVAAALRRHRGVAFGLAFVISAAIRTFARLVRAGYVFAREGVFGTVDPAWCRRRRNSRCGWRG